MKMLKSLLETLGIRTRENINQTDESTSAVSEEVLAVQEFNKNYNLFIQKKNYWIINGLVKGEHVLIHEQGLVNSDDSRLALENEAKTKELENYNIFSLMQGYP